MTAPAPVCYRHPSRVTRLSCSNCGRPICSDCSIDASVGQKCPECSQQTGKVITAARMRRRSALTPAVGIIMGVTATVSLIALFSSAVLDAGSLASDQVASGEWYRIFTSVLLHGSILHLLFNMYALYLFGPGLEAGVGPVPFVLLYAAAGLAGGAAFLSAEPGVSAVGASGAVFGVLGAWLAESLASRHTLRGQANLRQFGILLLINLVFGFSVPGIAWQAHLGGLAAGFVIAWAWTQRRRQAATWNATAVVVAVVSLAIGLMVS